MIPLLAAQLNGLRTALYYTTMAAPSSSSVATEQSSTAPVTTSTITPLSPILSPSIQPQQHTAVPSSQLPKQTPGLTKPHNTNSETVIFGLAGIIVSLGLIIILLVLALTLALTHNHKLKKLVTASKLSQTYEVPVIPNSGVVNGSSVSTPSNNSICKDPGFNQGYDRLLQSHNSRTSTPRRLALEYELPVISNIATNSHTALNVSTESINNARNYGHTNHGYFHKLHTARTTPQEYEVPVITNIAATSENGLTDSSESNDLAMSGAYDTVLLSPLPSGVYDYIPQSTDDVTMVIHCESESERLRHASTRTYEEVEIYNDIAQTEK